MNVVPGLTNEEQDSSAQRIARLEEELRKSKAASKEKESEWAEKYSNLQVENRKLKDELDSSKEQIEGLKKGKRQAEVCIERARGQLTHKDEVISNMVR